MKKSKLLLLSLPFLLLTSCGGAKVSSDTLVITAVRLGYGLDWLYTLKDKYTEETGQKIKIIEQIGSDGNSAIQTELNSLAGRSDILAFRPNIYFKQIYQGSVKANNGNSYDCIFEDLTDIYTEKYDGETNNNTMEKKMYQEFKDYCKVNDKYYAIPWANGFMSIVRNLDVWKDLGYEESYYPRTTDEWFELMDEMNTTIKNNNKQDSVAPMIYCKSDEYYTSIMTTWFAQYEGKEEMQKFYNGLDPNGERSPNLYAYQGILESLKVLDKLVEYDSKTKTYTYQSNRSDSVSFTQMQNYFQLGAAAMCINGTWLEIESKVSDAEIDYIKIPLVSSVTDRTTTIPNDEVLRECVTFVDNHAKVGDNEGRPNGVSEEDIEIIRDSRISGAVQREDYDHLFVVPSCSSNKVAAKKFLKWIYSDSSLQLFYDTMNGHHLPATLSNGDYNTNNTTVSKFRSGANKIIEEGYFCTYELQTKKDKIFSVAGVSATYSNGISNACRALVEGKTPEQIVNANIQKLTDEWTYISSCL